MILLEYLGIVRSCLIHNKYCNFLFPSSLVGAFCKNLIIFSTDLTLETFNLKLFSLSTETLEEIDKYLRIAKINISTGPDQTRPDLR